MPVILPPRRPRKRRPVRDDRLDINGNPSSKLCQTCGCSMHFYWIQCPYCGADPNTPPADIRDLLKLSERQLATVARRMLWELHQGKINGQRPIMTLNEAMEFGAWCRGPMRCGVSFELREATRCLVCGRPLMDGKCPEGCVP